MPEGAASMSLADQILTVVLTSTIPRMKRSGAFTAADYKGAFIDAHDLMLKSGFSSEASDFATALKNMADSLA
jgi:hypothetical protein